MSLETDIRRLADGLAEHRLKNAVVLDRETFRVLNEASMQAHHIARQLRDMTRRMVDFGTKGQLEQQEADALEERRYVGGLKKSQANEA